MARFFGLRGSKLNAAIWGVSCFCIMIFGYNNAAAGGVLTTQSFQKQFPQINTADTTGAQQHYNATIQGTAIGSLVAAGIIGSIACIFLGDILGRRLTIFVAVTFNLVGFIVQGTAFSLAQLIVGRIFSGLGTGAILSTTSVWQAEVSKPANRGSHVSAFGIFCAGGLVVALWIEFGTLHVNSSFAWRFPFLVPIIFCVIIMSFIFYLPESPRWLVKKGRIEEAKEIFSAIYEEPPESETVVRNIRDIQLSIELARDASLSSLFEMGTHRTFHRVCLAATIQMYLQLTGVNAIAFYASTIYVQYLHFSATIADILAPCEQMVVMAGAILCSYTVDRFGRRTLMLTSSAGMTIAMTALAGLTSQTSNTAALKAAVFFIYFYFFVYVLGFLGIPFLYASEIAPLHLRAAVCGISTAVSWAFNFLVVEITPVAFNEIGYRYFIVFAVCQASCIPLVYYFYPETAGRSLEEIDEIFAKSTSIFDTVRVAQELPRQRLSEFLVEEGKIDVSALQIEKVEGYVNEHEPTSSSSDDGVKV